MCFLENKVIPNSLYESILYALVKFILQVIGYSFCLKYCFPFFFFLIQFSAGRLLYLSVNYSYSYSFARQMGNLDSQWDFKELQSM